MKTKITGEMKWNKWEIIWNWMGDKMGIMVENMKWTGKKLKWREMMGWYEKYPEITKLVWGFLLIPRSEKSRGWPGWYKVWAKKCRKKRPHIVRWFWTMQGRDFYFWANVSGCNFLPQRGWSLFSRTYNDLARSLYQAIKPLATGDFNLATLGNNRTMLVPPIVHCRMFGGIVLLSISFRSYNTFCLSFVISVNSG